MINFIPRRYIDNTTNDEFNFDALISKNKISIILGEPASGKTHQLEEYEKENVNSKLVELMSLEYEEVITKDIEVILLDSIDEALSKNDSDKILIKRLIIYIKTSQKINPNIKFIITCRYVEWKESFEEKLKGIDKELKIYYIEELLKEDINQLLEYKNIENNEFWNFIEENYLEQLLKNILMTIHLIDNFDNYKGQKLKYFELYKEIIISHLIIKTDNERTKVLDKLSQDEVFKILSIIAIYMTLNRQREINIENISKFTSELYKIEGIELTGEKLKLVFDTSLFNGNIKNTRFFHKSIQEYLSAYFINIKKLDLETIKELFSHKEGFYEEFEEVIIYLTNMEERFFYHFVEFDPLIFRRHPYLNENEQRSLLISMLNVLQTERQKVWSKWKYLDDSTLTRFELNDICKVIDNHIIVENCDKELFYYLVCIFEFNNNKKLENILFNILESKQNNHYLCISFMSIKKICNQNYNQRLYKFIKINNLFIDAEEDFYYHVFNILYNNIEFENLIILIENCSSYYEQIVKKISLNDIIYWSNSIIGNAKKELDNKHQNKLILLLMSIILEKFNKVKEQDILEKLIEVNPRACLLAIDFFDKCNEADAFLLNNSIYKKYKNSSRYSPMRHEIEGIKNQDNICLEDEKQYVNIIRKKNLNASGKFFINEYITKDIACNKDYVYTIFDNKNIDPYKIQSFKRLISNLYNNYHSKLNNENKKLILEQYYEFFQEYYYPNAEDSSDIYYDMNQFIENILESFQKTIKDISLLENLLNSKNELLRLNVKYRFEIIYNLMLTNREFNNDYYKNILNNFIEKKEDKRFFDYEKLQNDLVEICLLETENRKKLTDCSEDEINDRFRTDLLMYKYNVADQSRGGESQSLKSVGERDIVIRNKESGIAETVIEAFNLTSLSKSVIEEHYYKLINKYDTTGNKQNFILIYSKVKNFNSLWIKYKNEYLESEEEMEKDNIKLGYSNEGNMKIFHIFINFYSEKVSTDEID